MAEALLHRKDRPHFRAHSAGSQPSGVVHPEPRKQIELATASTEEFRSKSWNEFQKPDAPQIDLVFTVCDHAASQSCPVWPGQPVTAPGGLPDPATVTGSAEQVERAFHDAFMTLDRRIALFLNLPLSTLDGLAIKTEIEGMGLA